MVVNRAFWAGKRVLITGHTGFKGSWLALWLHKAGAELAGYALDPPTHPNLFDAANIASVMRDTRADVRDLSSLQSALRSFAPEIVFHLAAQPLVLASHRNPVETYAVNVLGTVHLLEALRVTPSVRACIVVTSDKCYDLSASVTTGHRESDPLGGADPYSSSKACAELVTAAYRASFFGPGTSRAAIATARAGNVIGGGDWADNRLLPDLIRSFSRNEAAIIRNPAAIRPWQHVLEPLSGYLRLTEKLDENRALAAAWNFGPGADAEKPVEAIVEQVCRLWGHGARWQRDASVHAAEAMALRLDATKASQELQWRPRLDLSAAVEWTVKWYSAFAKDASAARSLVDADIDRYEAVA
jgi:CDP-glucose 4,6-dehydratase